MLMHPRIGFTKFDESLIWFWKSFRLQEALVKTLWLAGLNSSSTCPESHKYGTKVFKLCDSDAYTYNMKILGRKSTSERFSYIGCYDIDGRSFRCRTDLEYRQLLYKRAFGRDVARSENSLGWYGTEKPKRSSTRVCQCSRIEITP